MLGFRVGLVAAAIAMTACGGDAQDTTETPPPTDPPPLCSDVTAAGKSATLRVMTINLRHDVDQWEDRFPLVADEIVRLDPDIIGMQEIEIRIDQSAALHQLILDRMGPDYHLYEHLKPDLAALSGEGVGIFSRFPLEDTETLELDEGRVGVFARVKPVDGLVLDVFDTHLDASGDPTIRPAEAKTIVDFLDAKKSCNATFLTGDMNSTDDSDTIATYVDADFVDTYKDVHGADTAKDGNTSPIKLAEGTTTQKPTKRIDYVFERSLAKVVKIDPTDSTVCFENHSDKGLWPSDHLGVMTTAKVSF